MALVSEAQLLQAPGAALTEVREQLWENSVSSQVT